MMISKILVFLSFAFLIISSCIEIPRPFSELPPGIWHAELDLGDGVILPFNFETSYDASDQLVIEIINAEERIPIEEYSFGRTSDLRDTVVFGFPIFDSYIKAEYKESVLEGIWHVNNREDYNIPFVAFHGQSYRFTTENVSPSGDLTGKWQTTFEVETQDAYPAIGEFVQKGNLLTGTFMTETGDYRYLEGTVQGDQFSLSCFDGSHAFLFTGSISKSETLTGKFYSGSHYKTNWIASKNPDAKLTDAYNLTQIITEDKKINFQLPNSEGDLISLNDQRYSGKAKLVTIMGTWCPNCLDESKFLLDYLKTHPSDNLEIIALAFEKYRNSDDAMKIIREYKQRLNIPYEVLLAGYYDKEEATGELGFLSKIISYPTLLFVNKDNEVVKVHTGFTGPATSEFQAFKQSFESGIRMISSDEE